MTNLKLNELVVPEYFSPYVSQKMIEISPLFLAGAVSLGEAFNRLASSPSVIVPMPFFDELDGSSELIAENFALNASILGNRNDRAPIIRRGKMWSSSDLATAMSGVDPLASVGDLVASFWSRDLQKELLAMLGGAFKSGSFTDNIHNISAKTGDDAKISPKSFIDACQKIGENGEKLCAVIMHSAVKAYLKKMNLIETVRGSDDAGFEAYQGVRVIVDDACEAVSGVYRSYLLGSGAIAFGDGAPLGFLSTELDRDKKMGAGVDYIISRKCCILHPRGMMFTGDSVAQDSGPSRVELNNAANWARAYDPKQIRIVAFDYKIG